MRLATVLELEAGRGSGPDLTRYFLVCAGSITVLLAAAWLFRRYVAGHLKARAAKRSLQVLDVLPLGGKQKLVVVRCYDRSFLLGLGDKEVRAIAELDSAAPPGPVTSVSTDGKPFAATLAEELVPRPSTPARAGLGAKEGLLA
jgi:flagellar biosynthetic protein FliO